MEGFKVAEHGSAESPAKAHRRLGGGRRIVELERSSGTDRCADRPRKSFGMKACVGWWKTGE
jgi:hypothetical protein